jgi:hypothetical protein
MKHVDIQEQRAKALTEAALKAAKHLGLGTTEVARILGVAEGAVLAMRKGQRTLDGITAEAERGEALVKITLRLQALLGPEETKHRAWIRHANPSFDGKPLDIMLQRDGCQRVLEHLKRVDHLA